MSLHGVGRSSFGQVISNRGIELDNAKIELLSGCPLLYLLRVCVPFTFTDKCHDAFYKIKQALISAPIIQSPYWSLPFGIMSDASDHRMGVVLWQRKDKKPVVIHYASRTLD